jgi:hypothetical protein
MIVHHGMAGRNPSRGTLRVCQIDHCLLNVVDCQHVYLRGLTHQIFEEDLMRQEKMKKKNQCGGLRDGGLSLRTEISAKMIFSGYGYYTRVVLQSRGSKGIRSQRLVGNPARRLDGSMRVGLIN